MAFRVILFVELFVIYAKINAGDLWKKIRSKWRAFYGNSFAGSCRSKKK